jgi:hypothetical protein
MPTGQQYATNVPQTTLTGSINAVATSFSVASSASWPSVPFTAVLDIGTSTQEPVDVTAVVGTTWTVTRSIDGTTGFSHAIGATVTHADIGRDFREARTHMDASTNVHGLSGGAAVVGDTQTQTLTNKTLTAPVISTISNIGTLTLPTGPETLVGRATTDTLTNKTLTSPVLNTPVLNGSGGLLTLPTGPETLVGAGHFLTGAVQLSAPVNSTTTAETDLCSATFTTTKTGAICLVWGTFDMQVVTSGTGAGLGFVNVDGSDVGTQTIYEMVTTSSRATLTQSIMTTLGTAGSHTVKLRGGLSASSGQMTFNATHTHLVYLVLDF